LILCGIALLRLLLFAGRRLTARGRSILRLGPGRNEAEGQEQAEHHGPCQKLAVQFVHVIPSPDLCGREKLETRTLSRWLRPSRIAPRIDGCGAAARVFRRTHDGNKRAGRSTASPETGASGASICFRIRRKCRAGGWCRRPGQWPACRPQSGYLRCGSQRSAPHLRTRFA